MPVCLPKIHVHSHQVRRTTARLDLPGSSFASMLGMRVKNGKSANFTLRIVRRDAVRKTILLHTHLHISCILKLMICD